MVNINDYLARLITLLRQQFGKRLRYVGLQGSYLRNEATVDSDIDVMLVIDDISISDLKEYRSILQSLEQFDRSCGFICGTSDLKNWNPLEICHLLHSTKDYLGALSELVPQYTKEDVQNFVKLSVNNLFHEICHRYIHASKSSNIAYLPASYKSVFFILQNKYYLSHGEYILTKTELLKHLIGIDLAVLEKSISINKTPNYDFDEYFSCLFSWCRESMRS